MLPSSSYVVERKKKRKGRREGAAPSVPAPGVCEPKQGRRRVQRQEPHEPGTYSLLL
jgi:hypothetical protein